MHGIEVCNGQVMMDLMHEIEVYNGYVMIDLMQEIEVCSGKYVGGCRYELNL